MRRIGWMVMALACSVGMTPVFGQAAQEQTPVQVVPTDQQPSDAQLAKLFETMRVKDQLATTTKMMPMLLQQEMRQNFAEIEKQHPELRTMTDAQRQQVSGIVGKYMTKAQSLYTPDEMLADMSAIYKKHLTSADVDAVTAFYGTPAGQHLLDMNSAVMTEFMPTVMQKMQKRMQPLILQMSQEMADALKSAAPGTNPEPK